MDTLFVKKLTEKHGELYAAQLELEEGYKQIAATRMETHYNKAKIDGKAAETPLGSRLIEHELEKAITCIKTFVEHTIKPKPGVKPAYHSIVEQLADIYEGNEDELYTLMAYTSFALILNCIFIKDNYLSNIAKKITKDIQDEAKLAAFLKEHKEHGGILDGINKRVAKSYKLYYTRHYMQQKTDFIWYNWEREASISFGARLIEILLESTACFTAESPTDIEGYATLAIQPSQWLLETWSKNENNIINKAFKMCPSVIPPAKWENLTTGGYYGILKEHSKLLRLRDTDGNTFSKEYVKQLNQVDMSGVLKAVNVLQETPWKVNKKILAVVQAIKKRGGEIGDFPRLEPFLVPPDLIQPYTDEELRKHKDKKIEIYLKENTRKSLALRALANLEIAEKYAGYDKIYFPCNMDFRGRIYPITPFGFQGDDINKALLLFADAPPCSSMKDIEWLMLQGACLAGVDKVSFDERKEWVLEHEEQILKSAADPLDFRWWTTLDDKSFQFLAFCFEWQAWKQYEAKHGTPKGFISGLPVAFDGTCSGLQHYSAILRDPIGGKAVNLIPSDKPQDIYKIVADKVNEKLQVDSKAGTPDETKENKDGELYLKLGTKTLAQQWLNYGVTRKVTKRSCMTLAYGSKEYGFTEQLVEDIIKPAKRTGKGHIFSSGKQAAKYMASLIWQAVQTTVVKAVDGMKWLQDMASIVCKNSRVVTWVTPMGLPIQQAYMKPDKKTYHFRFGGTTRRRVYDIVATGNIDKKKQAQGIAPNFIHSMDASHLQLTLVMAKESGINHFAMIHDSYAAPISQAGLMFQTVRNAFVKMYTENDVLLNFKNDIAAHLDKNTKFPEIPEKGTLDLEQIRGSLYTFH